MQILSRRTKNNPVLIGEPGVGKTAIVEKLAMEIIEGDVPVTRAPTADELRIVREILDPENIRSREVTD